MLLYLFIMEIADVIESFFALSFRPKVVAGNVPYYQIIGIGKVGSLHSHQRYQRHLYIDKDISFGLKDLRRRIHF